MNSNALNSALKQTAKKLGVSLELVEQVYRSYWSFVRETIASIPLKTVTREEAKQLTTNFNIPYIGKLHVDYGQIIKYHNRLKQYQDARNKENQTNGQSSAGVKEPL